MVKFIVGKADFDISGKIRREICELARANTSALNIVFIVPEQFEYETERAVYRMMKKNGLLKRSREVKITTFSKLAAEILRKDGDNRPRADETIKNIIMHKAVNDCKDELSALSNIAKKPGFCGKMTDTVASLRSAGLSPDGLEVCLGKVKNSDAKNEMLIKKLTDTARIFGRYETFMSGYLDVSEIISPAAEIIRKESFREYENADFFVDCFNDFTGGQLEFLRVLMGKARNVTFGFFADPDSGRDVFSTANSHISKLRWDAQNAGQEVAFNINDADERYASSPLFELSQKLFSNEKCEVPAENSCELFTAADIYEEADFVCAKIKRLIDEKGFRCRDIAVLCTDLSVYGRYMENAFRKYEIPMFSDSSEPILYRPLINLVNSILNVAADFSADTVLSCVKTGFFCIFDEKKNEYTLLRDSSAAAFEDYLFEWMPDPKKLKMPFEQGLDDPKTAVAEEVRKRVAEPILRLSEKLSKGKTDGGKIVEMLYEFLREDVKIKDSLSAKCRLANGARDTEKTELSQRLWDTLVGIFNALHKELSGIPLAVGEFAELFRDVCAQTALASPPQTVDSVLVGDIDRTRADGIKAAFIVGASYEAFPTPAPQTGIFSRNETEIIRESIEGMEEFSLKSTREQYCLSLYRAYRAVCLPTEYLCISCPEISADGEPLQLSGVFGDIKRLYGDVEIKKASTLGDEFYCRSVRAAKLRFAMRINSNSRENAVLKKALIRQNCGEFVQKIEEISFARGDTKELSAMKHKISPEAAQLLFPAFIGATQAEKLAQCKFSYFCETGLGIYERRQRIFNSIHRGDAMHFILENVLKEIGGDAELMCSLKRGEILWLCRKHLEEFARTETVFTDDARSRFLFGNIVNSAADVLISMQSEFYAGSYRPKFFELDLKKGEYPFLLDDGEILVSPPPAELFSDAEAFTKSISPARGTKHTLYTEPLEIPLEDRKKLYITGRIDRVDMFSAKRDDDNKEKIYIRTVDYKSSVRGFDIFNAKNGVNIQMMLYLAALLRSNKELSAGGVFYIPSRSSGALSDAFSPFRLIALNHRGSGLTVLDENTEGNRERYVKFVMDRVSDENKGDEKALDTVRKAFATDDTNSVKAENFNSLCDDILGGVGKRYSELFSGNVEAVPIAYAEPYIQLDGSKKNSKSDKHLQCRYCRFADICQNGGKVIRDLDDERAKKSETAGTKDTKENKEDSNA